MGAEPPDAQVCSLTAESVARPRPLCVLARRTGRRATIPALARNKMYPKRTMNEHEARKTPVFAAVERGVRVVATVIPDSRDTHRHVREFVLPRSVVYTDDWKGYMPLRDAYKHRRINHSAKIYVSGDVHTQTIEGFFGNMKTGIRGAHHSISRKWLQGYLNEWTWRYNHRDDGRAMFLTLIHRGASTEIV